MSRKVNPLSPCVTFFSAGRPGTGLCNLLLQVTILLWPLAFLWARHYNRAAGVQLLLADFSRIYNVPRAAQLRPRKRFRRADLSEVYRENASFGHLQKSQRAA